MTPAYTVSHVRSWTWIKFAQKPDQPIRERIYTTLHARHCHGRGEWYIRSIVTEAEIAKVITGRPRMIATTTTQAQPVPPTLNTAQARIDQSPELQRLIGILPQDTGADTISFIATGDVDRIVAWYTWLCGES
jgi:hypothetical protein